MSNNSDAVARGIVKASGSTVLAVVLGLGTWFLCCIMMSFVGLMSGANLPAEIGGYLLALSIFCPPIVAILPAVLVGAIVLWGVLNGTGKSTASTQQPEPQSSLVQGVIAGLPDDTPVTIHIRTPSGWEAAYNTKQGNGLWKAVVITASGPDYIVTAEAEGYVSSPASYTVHISGAKAYVVEQGQVTGNQALNLDFYFEPVGVS